MPTREIVTRCTSCPTIIERQQCGPNENYEKALKDTHFIIESKYGGMRCPNCHATRGGILTVTSYVIDSQDMSFAKPDKVEEAVVETLGAGGTVIITSPEAIDAVANQRAEITAELKLAKQALDWLAEKGKEGSVLFRATTNYIVTLDETLEALT